MSDTTVVRTGSGAAVRLERHLADPPATVWQALTDRQQLQSWFPCDVEVAGGTWTPGAAITFVFPPDVIDLTLTGEVLVVDEPRRLAFTWGDETLRFELSEEGGGTRLVLVDELPASAAARNAAGWEDCLDRLTGIAPDPGAWNRRFEAFSAAFEPEFGHQKGPPAGYKGDSAD